MFFKLTSLQHLGLQVHLGHGGIPCDFRIQGHKDFLVIDMNGIHSVELSFCGCSSAPTHRDQLLEVGWWPSTPLEPQTVATMSVLQTFHVLNLQGQVAPTDFYCTIKEMTCGDGLTVLPVSYSL